MRISVRFIALLVPVMAFMSVSVAVRAEERLSWTYDGYEKLAKLFESEEGPLYGEKESRRVYHLRFVVEGESLEDWVEILETVSTRRKDEPKQVQLWLERFRVQGDKTCPGDWTIIDEQDTSITFLRSVDECPEFGAQDALYRVLYGKKKVFLIFATRKGRMSEDLQASWLRVLNSAEIRK
jgi:hypothetical protein